jgi:hypothetical protein
LRGLQYLSLYVQYLSNGNKINLNYFLYGF